MEKETSLTKEQVISMIKSAELSGPAMAGINVLLYGALNESNFTKHNMLNDIYITGHDVHLFPQILFLLAEDDDTIAKTLYAAIEKGLDRISNILRNHSSKDEVRQSSKTSKFISKLIENLSNETVTLDYLRKLKLQIENNKEKITEIISKEFPDKDPQLFPYDKLLSKLRSLMLSNDMISDIKTFLIQLNKDGTSIYGVDLYTIIEATLEYQSQINIH